MEAQIDSYIHGQGRRGYACVCHYVPVEVRGQFVGTGSPLPHVVPGINSSHQAWPLCPDLMDHLEGPGASCSFYFYHTEGIVMISHNGKVRIKRVKSCQRDGIWNHPGTKLLRISLMVLPGTFGWSGKTHPECGWHCLKGGDGKARGIWAPASIALCLLTVDGMVMWPATPYSPLALLFCQDQWYPLKLWAKETMLIPLSPHILQNNSALSKPRVVLQSKQIPITPGSLMMAFL